MQWDAFVLPVTYYEGPREPILIPNSYTQSKITIIRFETAQFEKE
jgi:hypothetical protein